MSNSRKEAVMTAGSVRSTGPLAAQMDGLHDWLGRSGCSAARSVRCEAAFTRFSSWMADRHLGLADLDGDVIEEYIEGEQKRIGSRTPAAFQYLPIARRYLTEAGVLASAGPVIRSRGGVPRLLAGPLAGVIYELVCGLLRNRRDGGCPGGGADAGGSLVLRGW
jgi:hypothetical protein